MGVAVVDALAQMLAVTQVEADGLREALGLLLALSDPLVLPVVLEEALTLCEAEGERCPEAEGQVVTERLPVGLPLRRGDAVLVRARASEGEGEAVKERLDVAQPDALVLREGVWEGEEECEAELHPDSLALLDALRLPLLEPEALEQALISAEGEGLPEGLLLGLPLFSGEPEVLVEVLRDRVTE